MNAWKHNTKQSELLVRVKPQTKASTMKIQDKNSSCISNTATQQQTFTSWAVM